MWTYLHLFSKSFPLILLNPRGRDQRTGSKLIVGSDWLSSFVFSFASFKYLTDLNQSPISSRNAISCVRYNTKNRNWNLRVAKNISTLLRSKAQTKLFNCISISNSPSATRKNNIARLNIQNHAEWKSSKYWDISATDGRIHTIWQEAKKNWTFHLIVFRLLIFINSIDGRIYDNFQTRNFFSHFKCLSTFCVCLLRLCQC